MNQKHHFDFITARERKRLHVHTFRQTQTADNQQSGVSANNRSSSVWELFPLTETCSLEASACKNVEEGLGLMEPERIKEAAFIILMTGKISFILKPEPVLVQMNLFYCEGSFRPELTEQQHVLTELSLYFL